MTGTKISSLWNQWVKESRVTTSFLIWKDLGIEIVSVQGWTLDVRKNLRDTVPIIKTISTMGFEFLCHTSTTDLDQLVFDVNEPCLLWYVHITIEFLYNCEDGGGYYIRFLRTRYTCIVPYSVTVWYDCYNMIDSTYSFFIDHVTLLTILWTQGFSPLFGIF